VGRKSRAKRLRREDPYRSEIRRALRADRRGALVAPTPAAYRAVYSRRGSDGIAEALIARHNERWSNVAQLAPTLGDQLVGTLHVAYPLDTLLMGLRAEFGLPAQPPAPEGTGFDQLRWAVDSAAAAVRLLMAGNAVGAASIVRTELERWTENRAVLLGCERHRDEDTAAFYCRVWTAEGAAELPAVAAWPELSEVLHGRGRLLPVVTWEANRVAERATVPAALLEWVHSVVRLSLRQVRVVAAQVMRTNGWPDEMSDLLVSMPDALPSSITIRDAAPLLWPLTYEYVHSALGGRLRADNSGYLERLRAVSSGDRTFPYSELAVHSFVWRRGRAADWARWAFEIEEQQLGAAFDPEGTAARQIVYVFVCEAASLIAAWRPGFVADALDTAASSLRAALWLWLEDDERAMVLARTVLQQTARARVWRTKPGKASKLEARGAQASGRDWLEEAGWRRLSLLNRSLGEFSHSSMRAKWEGARDALAALSPVPMEAPWTPQQTARGSALNKAAYVFGLELRHQADANLPELGEALRELLPFGDDDAADADVEAWMAHVWSLRSHPLTPPTT
jgi:hypothetical protein